MNSLLFNTLIAIESLRCREALIIAPRNDTEIMILLPDLTMHELSVEAIIQGGDYRDGYVLLLGQAANNVSRVSLHKLTQEGPFDTVDF